MLHLLLVADNVFTLSDRTEARIRAPDPITNAVALDLDTLVDARAVMTTPKTTFTLADMPRYTLLDYNNSATRQGALSDGVLAAAEWHSHRARIRLAESASYGQFSFESLSVLPAPGSSQVASGPTGQSPPPPMLVPSTSKSILYASSLTSVDTTLQLRPWTLFAKVGYQLSGGANETSQQLLPFQQGPLAQATADLRVDARGRDHLSTVAAGSEASFSLDTEDLLVGIEEQWRHRWARGTETLLGGGWYAVRSRDGVDAPDAFSSSPVAEAAFDQRFLHGKESGELRFDVRLAPLISPLSGLVDEQIRGSIEGKWVRRRLNLRAVASAGESVDQGTSVSVRQALCEIDAAYTVSKWLTVDGGVRGLYQSQNALGSTATPGGTPPIVEQKLAQVVVFFAVSVRAVKARF